MWKPQIDTTAHGEFLGAGRWSDAPARGLPVAALRGASWSTVATRSADDPQRGASPRAACAAAHARFSARASEHALAHGLLKGLS